jgi:glucose-1-phosphate thymidylyltransferase
MDRVGIVLAGGRGTRLLPLTTAISKQLLPVYDKPLIYYPIDTLKKFGIKEILIICMPDQIDLFKKCLGDGSQWGLQFSFEIQTDPKGLADAFILGEKFINGRNVTLILGDNIFVGNRFIELSQAFIDIHKANIIYGYKVQNPEQYGVIEFDSDNTRNVKRVVEKPQNPPSNYACVGLYAFDHTAVEKAKKVVPSTRGEIEIVDVINQYIQEGDLNFWKLDDGEAWFDCGTLDDLLDCANYIKALQKRANTHLGLI